MIAYPMTRPSRLSLDRFARQAGLHPQLAQKFVALGLLDAERDATGALWFRPAALVTVARVQRLRAGLSLNYAATVRVSSASWSAPGMGPPGPRAPNIPPSRSSRSMPESWYCHSVR